MREAHREELTFAAVAAADHLRTAGMRTKCEFAAVAPMSG